MTHSGRGPQTNHTSLVMPWLDHGIHAVTLPLDRFPEWRSIGMDCRVKPCNDARRERRPDGRNGRRSLGYQTGKTVTTWKVCMSPSSSLMETYSPGLKACAPKR